MCFFNMIQRTNPSRSKWNSLYLEKSRTVPWNLTVFLAGVSRLFLRFWWNYPKNYEITWVIRFTENRPKITKTEPRSCKIYTKDLNFPLSPSSRLGPGLIHKYQTSWSVLGVNIETVKLESQKEKSFVSLVIYFEEVIYVMSFCIICVKKLINRFEILDQTGSSAHLIPPSRTNQAGKWRENSGNSLLFSRQMAHQTWIVFQTIW